MRESKRAQIAVNTIFYILMVVFMIAIIVFGMQKLFFTKDIISEHERLEIQKELIEALEYCDDPLNSKNLKYFEFRNKMFNGMCVLGDDFDENHYYYDWENFDVLAEGNDNVVLLKTNFHKNSEGKFIPVDVIMVDIFKVDVGIPETFCIFDYENTGVINLELLCI